MDSSIIIPNNDVLSTLVTTWGNTWVLWILMSSLKALSSTALSVAFIVFVVNPFILMCIRIFLNVQENPRPTFWDWYKYDVQSVLCFYMTQFATHTPEGLSIGDYVQMRCTLEKDFYEFICTRSKENSFRDRFIFLTMFMSMRPLAIIFWGIVKLLPIFIVPCLGLVCLFSMEWYHETVIREAEVYNYMSCLNKDLIWVQLRKYVGLHRGFDCDDLKPINFDESWFSRTLQVCLNNTEASLGWYMFVMIYQVVIPAFFFTCVKKIGKPILECKALQPIKDFFKICDDKYQITRWVVHACMVVASNWPGSRQKTTNLLLQ